jgi:group I intron endonuclease
MDQQLGTSFYLPEGTDTACGIYMIRNVRNGKKYIGSTKNARNREKSHFKALSLGKHHCDHLQYAWNAEFDKSVFIFAMFIYCEEPELKILEQKCFDTMRPDYNSSRIAYRPEMTTDVCAKISRHQKKDNSIHKMDPEVLAERNSLIARKALANGTHSSQTLTHEQLSARSRRGAQTQLENGNHSSQTMSDADKKAVARRRAETLIASGNGKRAAKTLVEEGRHPFQLRTKEQKKAIASHAVQSALSNGTHSSQTMTKEQKTAKAFKIWETRRWNKLNKLLEETPIWCS